LSSQFEDSSVLTKNFLLFDTAEEKMGLDFDLVSVLKSVENFENFKKVYLDDSQRSLYDSVSNPIIKVNTLDGSVTKAMSEEEKDQNNLNEFRHNLMMIIERGKLSKIEKKMLENVGLRIEDIKKLSEDAENCGKKNKIQEKKPKLTSTSQEVTGKQAEAETEEMVEAIDPNAHEFINEINRRFGL
jgi:hypothetical protein